MFPGEGGKPVTVFCRQEWTAIFQPPDFVPAFPENMAPGEEQFPLLAADMALEERGQPLGNRIQFLPERGKPLCFRPPEKEYRIQWNCPMVPGVSGSRHGFPGLPCAAVSMNARRIWTERFQIRFRAGAVFFFIPGPGQELEVPFRRQRRHVSVQGDI